MDTQIYIDDLLNRFGGYSFTETQENALYTVQFLDAADGIVQEATKMTLLDCYLTIRDNLLGVPRPQFRLTATQIAHLDTTEIELGITILNLDDDTSVCWNGTEWASVAGDQQN